MPTVRTYSRICKHCGAKFTHTISGRGAPRRTCSNECRNSVSLSAVRARLAATECTIEGCPKPLRSRGAQWCEMHYTRNRLSGEPGEPQTRVGQMGEATPNWKGDAVSYRGLHSRITRMRGRASEYSCVDCGERAHHWSYDHEASHEIHGTDSTGYALVWTTDVSHYEPRCASCHREFDIAIGAK